MGRPGKQPHPLEKQIEGLAAINCTWVEVAAVTGIPERTARRKFGDAYAKGRENGKASLKRKMWETAMGGNVTMMIWLSKQMLGYTDKQETNTTIKNKEEIEKLSKLPTPELVIEAKKEIENTK